MNYLGTFKLGPLARITDPCYKPGLGEEVEVVQGTWNAAVSDGNSYLIAWHVGVREDDAIWAEEHFCWAGVDSGQLSIYDASSDYSAGDFGDGENGTYGEACRITLNDPEGAGIYRAGDGVVSRTQWGDGSYDVLVTKYGGKVSAIRINMGWEAEDE